jgi:hypothetical protein
LIKIGYLDELETKQKIQSVRYPADFLRKYLDSLILNLTKGKERYVELLDETLKKELRNLSYPLTESEVR